jgi:CheY-like chemotaxis protein
MTCMAEDDIVQLIDDPREKPAEQGPRWKIAVIDDEPAVHDGTRFALSDYRLHGQGLEILSAYSAAEGRELMRRHSDVAVVLLDVIMETDTAGLSLVEFIRKELKNETVRFQIDAAAGRRRSHPDRVVAECGLRRNPGVARAAKRP